VTHGCGTVVQLGVSIHGIVTPPRPPEIDETRARPSQSGPVWTVKNGHVHWDCILSDRLRRFASFMMAERAHGSAVRRFAIRPAALPCSVRSLVRAVLYRALPRGPRTSRAATINNMTVLCMLPSLCGYLDCRSAHWDYCSPTPCVLFFDSQCTAGQSGLMAVSLSCVFSWLTFISSWWFGEFYRGYGGCSCRCWRRHPL